ncbi:alpha/beta fold hydrolase [Paenarthrobacter sp. JL.01a]|uniref:alpha/beta fold hydrolase n=1 Tax=Paenarthrobacter sp. JL.01a TaxID=2979324 RepID=UPI0021CA25EB|nr:alpha/beta hydrolase [Paenarthrobacter sp. JL.01a]UXM93751.1 alpha/beta hydrolase [Paenarthrobacter sp. JL.01a]
MEELQQARTTTQLTVRDGTELHYSDRGREDGPVLVLIHEWKGSLRNWDKLLPHLAPHYRVVSYDLPGMGLSGKPRSTYDFKVMAEDLFDVLQELDLQDVTLVGSSMGCSVILEYMQRHGDRTARIVLNNGPVMLVRRGDFPFAMPAEQFEGYIKRLTEEWPLPEWGGLEDSESHPALMAWHFSIAMQTPLDIALEVARQQAKLDHREAIASLTVPTLAAYSDSDPFYPLELGQWIADTAPEGQLAIFHESGHATPFEGPARFAKVLHDFVTPVTP